MAMSMDTIMNITITNVIIVNMNSTTPINTTSNIGMAITIDVVI